MVFIKKGAPKVAESGTRPGLSGQTLVSTGLADFDKLLGGGLPLGTVTLLLEDNFTQHHNTLLKYFLAEGAAHKHPLYWAAGQPLARTLPQKVNHIPKEEAKEKQQEGQVVQLRIAWQYRRYIRSKQKAAAASASSTTRSTTGSKARSSTSSSAGIRDWCHNFDLTKSVPVQDLGLTHLGCHAISGKKGAQSLVPSCQAFVKSLAEAIPSPQSHSGSTTDGTPTGQQVATADRGTNTVASGSNQKLVAKKPGAARLSDLHTLSPAQSEAALQRLRLSDETASSTAQHAPESRSVSDAKQSAPHKPAAASQGSTADAAQGGDIASSHALAPSDIQATSASHLVNTAQLSFFPGTHAPSEAAASDPAPGRLAVAGQMVSQASSMASTASTEPPQVKSPFSPITAADLAYAAQQQLQQRVGRVVIQSLGGLGWGLESYDQDTERQLFSAVLQIKALTRSSRCAAMLSFPAGLYTPSLTTRLIHLCDTVVGLESVRDNSDLVRLIPDALSCCGLLHLQKLPSLNALGPPLPESTLFLIRHKRRRIAIQAVQTDPDAEAAEADGKSAAASLCGGPPKADKPFDF